MEGAEAAIVTCTAHTPYTTFQLTQVTPSFLGPEIMCWPPGQANIIRRWHLHKCHYFTGSASRFNPCHKQNTDKEPVGMCAYICMYISILNTTALQKKKKKITGEQIFSHQNISKDHIKMACHKEAAGKRPKNKSENTKAGSALEPIYFSEAMICTIKIYRQRVFFKASYQSVTTGSSH